MHHCAWNQYVHPRFLSQITQGVQVGQNEISSTLCPVHNVVNCFPLTLKTVLTGWVLCQFLPVRKDCTATDFKQHKFVPLQFFDSGLWTDLASPKGSSKVLLSCLLQPLEPSCGFWSVDPFLLPPGP